MGKKQMRKQLKKEGQISKKDQKKIRKIIKKNYPSKITNMILSFIYFEDITYDRFKNALVGICNNDNYLKCSLYWTPVGELRSDTKDFECICGKKIKYAEVHEHSRNLYPTIHIGRKCGKFFDPDGVNARFFAKLREKYSKKLKECQECHDKIYKWDYPEHTKCKRYKICYKCHYEKTYGTKYKIKCRTCSARSSSFTQYKPFCNPCEKIDYEKRRKEYFKKN